MRIRNKLIYHNSVVEVDPGGTVGLTLRLQQSAGEYATGCVDYQLLISLSTTTDRLCLSCGVFSTS